MSSANDVKLLEMTNIHKSFPGVQALKGVNFDVRPGEVHALVGENGAGKSTLMHILAGVHQPDSGTIQMDGKPVTLNSEQGSLNLGIGMVFQERSLVASLSVAENIYFNRQPTNALGVINHRAMYQQARALLAELNLNINPKTEVGRLSPAQQQMVEIAKALSLNARLLIFDEPTAALTETETDALFKLIARLTEKQVGIIYISHRLEEIFQIAERVSVLKDGAYQGTLKTAETRADQLISLMVGRTLLYAERSEPVVPGGEPALRVENLSDRDLVRNVSFSLYPGEVVGLAGLAGAGRTETALAIFGGRRRTSGEVFVHGRKANIRTPKDAIAHGIGYLPENRREAGLFLDMTIIQNVVVSRLEQFGRWWQREKKMTATAREFQQKLSISTPGLRQIVQKLSGGNQQKVVISRWLLVNPIILIADEPTRGIDVGAKAEVHRLLRDLARQGKAVLVISSDLPEILSVSDRILVMREGRITGELMANEATEEKILNYASISSLEAAS